jgi:hypothetical protein
MAQSMTRQIIDCHPAGYGLLDRKKLDAAILGLYEAAQAATACADGCLNEGMIKEMTACVRSCQDAADVCEAAAKVLSRWTAFNVDVTRAVLAAAVAVLGSCGDECARHASMHMHCRLCAETCRRAEKSVQAMLDTLD